MIRLSRAAVAPLESFSVEADKAGRIEVRDAQGRIYYRGQGPSAQVTASGALGVHTVLLRDPSGEQLGCARVTVDCETHLHDNTGTFQRLMHMLKTTFIRKFQGLRNTPTDEDRVYRLQSVTSRDTVHVHKGSLYFMPGARDVIDLFARYQPEDGMIWDFGIDVTPGIPYHFEWRWGKRWSLRTAGGKLLFARQPVMNDLEHMYIRGLWQSWRATGDDEWMSGKLDSALAAMRFSARDEYFWSDKFKLLKRPWTIDLWDYQSQYDAALVDGDIMDARPGVSVYGVFHGDNTGMADAARKLAQMLRFAGRDSDAAEADRYADHLQETLDDLAWNGEFYTHHVSEDPSFERDFGVDESEQVSLSNTYALNRGIDHDKAVAIIMTYQRIRREMPESSPAEWFGIYPPCQKGFGIPPWWYTNGGVTIMTAGELAHGAFEHGFEDYGADILKRTVELFSPHGDAFVGGLRGKAFEAPERTFRALDIRQTANADLVCHQGQGHPGWTDDPNLDMRQLPAGRQTFEDVPFEILDSAADDGKAMVRLHASRPGYAREARIGVGGTCGSIYLLHACAGSGVVGELSFVYADGSRESLYMKSGTDVLPYWNPSRPRQHRRRAAETIVAWTASNETCPRFGLSAHGVNNPQPDKPVQAVELSAGRDGATWLVVAATASDAATFFQPDETEPSGVPPRWGAGALMYALVEGIGGAYDADRNFQAARIAPRWSAAGVDDVTMAVRYADGGGYVRYRYRREGDTLKLDVAGNSDRRHIEMLLPAGSDCKRARVDGVEVQPEIIEIEQSRYACFQVECLAASAIEVDV